MRRLWRVLVGWLTPLPPLDRTRAPLTRKIDYDAVEERRRALEARLRVVQRKR